jgi:hypothetical protein
VEAREICCTHGVTNSRLMTSAYVMPTSVVDPSASTTPERPTIRTSINFPFRLRTSHRMGTGYTTWWDPSGSGLKNGLSGQDAGVRVSTRRMSTGARAASPDCGRCRRGEHTSAHRLCVRFMSGDGIDHRTGSSAWVFAWPCRGLFSTDQTLRRTPSRRSKWLKHGHLSMRRGHPSIHRIPAKCPTSKPDIPPARFPVV